ncbi:Uncharacterized protein APZ42_004313 [Daphnia magna]|uniref:Uncharacterized protein n=1 Tax=Daphnia magna TaxID=35525 RepID=A0A164H520_9CRUS|nr:Uncharacterized protein APZ42_004313 [Daphnia magna]
MCQLLVEMEKEHGLDQHCIPHSSLESWCAHSCSGTFSSVQVTNNVREIYHPHETWSRVLAHRFVPCASEIFTLPEIIVRVRDSCMTMMHESLA